MRTGLAVMAICLAMTLGGPTSPQTIASGPQTPASRRSQRVQMQALDLRSPNGQVTFTFLPNAERLSFTIRVGDTTVIEPSPIVLTLDGYDLSAGVVQTDVVRDELHERYPWSGGADTAISDSNRARLFLTNDLTSTPYALEVRAFDDGVAYRQIIPGSAAALRVPDEWSTFNLPAGSTVWYAGMDGHYEAPYVKRDLAAVQAGEWAGPPLTFKLPQNGGYASITEANLVNYSGMGLESNGRGGWVIGLGHRQPLNYPFELRYGRDEARRLGKAAAIQGDITTPWRVVMIGRDLNALATSTILPNLCPPPDTGLFPEGIRTSWIKPGRAVWRYVDGGPTGVEGMKAFSRMAGELGFEHHVIEGIWRKWTTEERREVVEYSRRQGVAVWFWQHTNQLRTPEAREEFFRMLSELGVAGAKLDFLDHEAKEVIDLYEALLRKAAEHRILIVFHGSNKPSGRERTWPNELVRESVRGMESSGMLDRALHQTTLPFTRYLAGPADYTTMLFTERRRDSSVAHQIASLVVFASPLLTIAANPESILASPAVDVIKSVPATWDETRVLAGSEIGQLVLFARRKGDVWFLAVMNGPGARAVSVPLSFLSAGRYQAALVRDDAPDGSAVRVDSAVQTRTDTIALDLRSGGGFLGRFVPANK